MLSEVLVVAPTQGPAWWKASKGDTVVWILGWPPGQTLSNLRWDDSTLKRRLRGATAFIAPPNAVVRFKGEWTEPVDPDHAARVSALLSATARTRRPRELTAINILNLYHGHLRRMQLDTAPIRMTERAAARARVPIVRAPLMEFTSREGDIASSDPLARLCFDALLDQIETPNETFRVVGLHWAQGRPGEAIAMAPRGWSMCLNAFMPGYSRRMIEVQTAAIAEALRTPGKKVAAAPLRQLVAEDGILARLRAQGFVIADPAEPFSD